MRTGTPSSSRNCLEGLPPSRVPFPAATTIATFIRLWFGIVDAREGGSCLHLAQGAARALAVAGAFVFVPQPSKDHLARGSLQDAGHGNVRVLSNQTPRIV